jgi:chromosome segregation ATPase
MSTAGKVLVILVALTLLPWIWLYSKVYELNAGYGAEIQKVSRQIDDLEKGVLAGGTELHARIAEVRLEQSAHDDALAVLRTRVGDVEKLEAESREEAERINLQLATVQEATEGANATVASREREKADTTKAIADTEQRVKSLQAEVRDRLDRLTEMRQAFLQTMEQNRQMLRRTESARSGRIRPASLAR